MKSQQLKIDTFLESKKEKIVKSRQQEISKERKEKYSPSFFNHSDVVSPCAFVEKLRK